MALHPFTISFPARILEGGSTDRVYIKVRAKSHAQAKARALAQAVADGQITGAADWRWIQAKFEGVAI